MIQESPLSSGLVLFYQATPARKLGLNNPAMRDFGFQLRVKNVDFAPEALPQILGLHFPVMPGQNRGQRRLGLDAGGSTQAQRGKQLGLRGFREILFLFGGDTGESRHSRLGEP